MRSMVEGARHLAGRALVPSTTPLRVAVPLLVPGEDWIAVTLDAPYIPAVADALYNRDILRLAASIPHHRRLEAPQASATRRSPVCGSVVTVDVVTDAEGRVAALGQEVRACALGQASAALMAAHALGRRPEELAEARDALADYLAQRRDDPGSWPGLALFGNARPYSARHPSILLAFEAAAEAAAQAARADAR